MGRAGRVSRLDLNGRAGHAVPCTRPAACAFPGTRAAGRRMRFWLAVRDSVTLTARQLSRNVVDSAGPAVPNPRGTMLLCTWSTTPSA